MLLTTKPGLSLRFGLEACPDVYASRIEPGEERLLVSIRAVDEVKRSVEKLLVRGLRALLGERAGIVAAVLAPLAETRIFAGRPNYGRCASQHAAWAKAQLDSRSFG